MRNVEEIILDYTSGKKTLPETNEELKEANTGLQLDPNRNVITDEEIRNTAIGMYPDMANGWGLMDHGVGCLEKVHVVNGVTVDVDMGAETAFVFIAGRKYGLSGNVLVNL